MKAYLIAAAVFLTGAASGIAQPMPSQRPSMQAPTTGLVQQIDYACGPGWRLTRRGDCVPRRGPPPPRYEREWGPPRHFRGPPRDWRDDRGPPRRWRDDGPPPRHWGPPPRW